MFKVGQRVKLNYAGKTEEFLYFNHLWNATFVVLAARKDICKVQLQELHSINNVKLGVYDVECKYFEPTNPICPICNQEVGEENNKIKQHNHNNEICYGSYTPCPK